MKTRNFLKLFALLTIFCGANLGWGQTPTPPGSYDALVMNGNNFVSVPHNNMFNVGPATPTSVTSTSYTGWFNLCNSSTNAMLYTKHFCNNTPGFWIRLLGGTGQLQFVGQIGGICNGANMITHTSNQTNLNDNQWHHFAVIITSDGNTGQTTVDMYIDGAQDANGPQLYGNIVNNNTTPLRIGVYQASNNNYSNLPLGRLDEFQVYGYALTQGEIDNIILGTPAGAPNAHFPFELPLQPITTDIQDIGSIGVNGTHYTVTPNTAWQTPVAVDPQYAVPSIIPVLLSDPCVQSVLTFWAQYSDGTNADPANTYEWWVLDGTWQTFGGSSNNANYFFSQPGTYQVVVNTTVGATGCDQTDTIEVEIDYCCEAAGNPDYNQQNNGAVIGNPTIWGGQSTDKFYIDGTVFVDALLDITNCDIVFSPTGELVVREGGFIRANNSTFRPCIATDSWRGIDFIAGTNASWDEPHGLFNECVFKNAEVALDIQTNHDDLPVSVTNNLFKNCVVGVNVNTGSNYNGNISGNTFEVDQLPLIDQASAAPYVNYAGIQISNTTVDLAVTQNDFVNLDHVNKQLIGINVTNNGLVSIIQNTFSDCINALFASDAFVKFENNDLSLSHELPANLGLIHVTGFSSAYRISYNELISTVPYNGDGTNPFFMMEGIHVENTSNTEINANHVEGFFYGMRLFNTVDCRVYENDIINSIRTGIFTDQSENLAISCNVIDLQYSLTFGTIGIEYRTTSPTNNDEIASNCILDTYIALGVADNNNPGNPPYNPLPDIKNNYLYNYAGTGISIGNMNGSIGVVNTPGRNSFWSNNGGIDVNNNPGTTVTADGNFNLVNPGVNMGPVTTNNVYMSTASCGHQEDPNNNQSLFSQEVCYEAAPFAPIVKQEQGKLVLNVQELSPYIANYGIEHTFNTILSMADFQGELDANLKNQLINAISSAYQDELAFYIGLKEHDPSIVSLLSNNNWDSDKQLYLKGLYELEFNSALTSSTFDEMTNYIDNSESKFRNKYIALQCQSEKRFVRTYIIDDTKESDFGPIEGGGKGIFVDNGFEIYPNPAGDQINLTYQVEDLEEGQMFRIYDANGRLVQEHTILNNASFTTIDISDLNSGMYYIEMIYSTYKPSIKEKFVKL